MKTDEASLKSQNPQLYQNFVDAARARFFLEPVLSLSAAIGCYDYTFPSQIESKIRRIEERGSTADYNALDAVHQYAAGLARNPFLLEFYERLLKVEQEARIAFAPAFEVLWADIAQIHCNYEREILIAIYNGNDHDAYCYRRIELQDLLHTYSRYFPELRSGTN